MKEVDPTKFSTELSERRLKSSLQLGREFLLAEVDDFDREVELVLRNDELMQLLAERSAKAERHKLNQVKSILDLA